VEISPGIFASSVSTAEWEFDPEVGGEMHVLCADVGVEAGLSRFLEAGEPIRWTIPKRETLLVSKARLGSRSPVGLRSI